MGRFGLFALITLVDMVLVGCADRHSPEPQSAAAASDSTQNEAPSLAERTLARVNERHAERAAERTTRARA